MNTEDLAYIAGLVDGEAYIGIKKNPSPQKQTGGLILATKKEYKYEWLMSKQ